MKRPGVEGDTPGLAKSVAEAPDRLVSRGIGPDTSAHAFACSCWLNAADGPAFRAIAREFRSPAFDGGDEADFAVLGHVLEEGVLVDDAVDRDGDAFLESMTDSREARLELAHEVADLPARHLVFDASAGEGARQRWRKDHARHVRALARGAYSAAARGVAASSAAESRGGDIGSSVMRTPVLRAMALPIAAIGGTIGTSPTPRTP